MKIKRTFEMRNEKGKIEKKEFEIELTSDELSEAHEEHVTNFMENELFSNFEYDKEVAAVLATEAYNEYAKGDGLTEYECIEKIVNKYECGELDFLFES